MCFSSVVEILITDDPRSRIISSHHLNMPPRKKKTPGNSPANSPSSKFNPTASTQTGAAQTAGLQSEIQPPAPPPPLPRAQPGLPPPRSTADPLQAPLQGAPMTHFPPEVANPMWLKVTSLPPTLRTCLVHDFHDINKHQSVKAAELWRILDHFDPQTKARPTHKKSKLRALFNKDVLPHIQPFILPPPPPAMDTDRPARPDFNPLGRTVKREQLREAIIDANPDANIPKSARIDSLQILYKAHVDPGLNIPGYSEYITSPRIVPVEQVQELTMEELRLTLQDHSPKVFVHSTAMTKDVLRDLYIKFVIQDPIPEGKLIAGFHYSLLR